MARVDGHAMTGQCGLAMPAGSQIFDRRLVRLRRDRAAPNFARHRFLFDTVASGLVERLRDVRRRFGRALDLGCRDGLVARALGPGDRVGALVQADLSPAMAARAPRPALALDEEALPFRTDSFDLVVSVLGLHWVNDLPGALVQIRRILRPDGLALLALFGAGTLSGLRDDLALAEAESGGAGARISPFVDVRTAGGLLQRAGFAMPVVDEETLAVRFSDPRRLFADLRGMGESNALRDRPRAPLRRAALQRFFACAKTPYECRFSIVTLTGWKPHEAQPKPGAPGSATRSLADALRTGERDAGKTVSPRQG